MNASGIEGRNASAEAVADRAAADARLHGELAAIVHTGIEAGAFADPFDGKTWAAPWRAVLARTALRYRALARRCDVGPVAPGALAASALLDVLASLASSPGGPSLLARVVERGSPGRAMPSAVSVASSPSPARAPGSPAARVRFVEAKHSPSSEVRPAVQLLADVRSVFAASGDPERIASAALDRALRALPDRPWRSMPSTGKALSAQGRGRMLAAVGIRAKTLQFNGSKDAKGYERTAFEPAWRALL